MISGNRLYDAGLQRCLARLEQGTSFIVDRADGKGCGIVAHPPVDDGARIDRDDVALAQDDLTGGDAMNDHVVDRGAYGRRKPPYPLNAGRPPPSTITRSAQASSSAVETPAQ